MLQGSLSEELEELVVDADGDDREVLSHRR